MNLTSNNFDTWDRCERRFAFELTHEPLTISPLGLLYAAVEASLIAPDPAQAAKDAILERTSRLDIDCGELSPISTVQHVEAMAEVISIALRERLGQAQRVPILSFGAHEWESNLYDFRGELHRIILTPHIDDDSLRSFAHSWQTIGELAMLERPITLTLIVIGTQRSGRRHSYWSKAHQHPVQKSAIRFAPRKRDEEFTANWRPIWREQSGISAESWLERMKSDGVLGELIISRKVQYNSKDQRMIQAKRDMMKIAMRMESATVDAPMRRSSCDEIGRGACPWQNVCYFPKAADPDDFPRLYQIREMPLAALRG